MAGHIFELLIVGAGPFGLSLAAWAHEAGMDYLCLGSPMEFWRRQMPPGMYLRSGPDWHLDPAGVHTLQRFLGGEAATVDSSHPLPIAAYLEYVQWLQDERRIRPLAVRATDLRPSPDGTGTFQVDLADRRTMRARHVAVALGFAHFPHIPVELLSLLPERSCAHTSRLVDFSTVNGERILIVGGRQSAFEWAALMNEAGAASVDVVHRHATPDFSPSEWAWVGPLVRRMRTDPGWYRRLEDDERRALDCRFWSEGRLKLEPWLAPRLAAPGVHLRPGCTIVGCHERSDGRLDIALSDGTVARVDRVVFATGYKVDLERVPLLRHLTATGAVRTRNGFPELDDHFQTSIPNLYVTSMPATQDFGPFLAFTVSACVSAALIGEAITTSPRGAFVQT